MQKEKKKIDRSVRSLERSRDKHFQLPDDVLFALDVACGCDSKPKLTPLPKIVSEGALLFAPDSPNGAVSPRIESDRGERRTSRREKVRIVEAKKTDESAEDSRKSLNRVTVSVETEPQTESVNEDTNTAVTNSTTPKPVTRSGSRNGPNSASRNSRVNSEKSEASQTRYTCGIVHDSWSRPTSTSTTSSNRGARNTKRKQSKCEGAFQCRKGRVSSGLAKLKGTSNRDSESCDSDYFDSDSDLDQGTSNYFSQYW